MLFISKNSEKNFKYIRQIPGLNYQQIYFYSPRYLLSTRINILELCSNDEWRQREMERLVLCSYLLWHRLVLIQMGFQREDISESLARVRNSLIYSGLQLSIRYGLTGRLPFFSSRDPLKKSTPTSMSFKDHFYGRICTIYIHIQKGGPSQPLLKNQFNVKPYLNLLEFAHFYFLFYKTHDQVL